MSPLFLALGSSIILKWSNHTFLRTTIYMAAPPITTMSSGDLSTSLSIEDRAANIKEARRTTLSLQEWQVWGFDSPLPAQVVEIVEEMIDLERESDAQMNFGGIGVKLKGDFKTQEDRKQRARFNALDDSEQKLQFFSARQIACRILGGRGYLCQKCWLPLGDCMCSRVVPCDLWHRIRFWLYMHPKDFLRENNTGKLLWQVFGTDAVKLCLFGIAEHEDIMWKSWMQSGRRNVWCLYPNKNTPTKSVKDSFAGYISNNFSETDQTDEGERFNFILIDGTWSNSAPMFKRLKERAKLIWGDALPCISLARGASAMHTLRPQPSWDRTCTAAAAIGLLDELHLVSHFKSLGLDKQAQVVENNVDVLLASLTGRRLRMGSSIARRHR